jgi:hypothetical protein
MNAGIKQLYQNLDEFIRRFYLDRMVRGFLYIVAGLGTLYLVSITVEHYYLLSAKIKIVWFYSIVGLTGFSLVYFILIPFLRLISVIPRISREEAAKIVGSHFSDIDDKLINTLQLLDKEAYNDQVNLSFLNASIEQRIKTFGIFKFRKVVNIRLNIKYLKYSLPPVLILLALLLAYPSLVVNSTERLVNYDSTYVPEAPFAFVLESKLDHVREGDNLTIKLKMIGESIPSNVMFVSDGFEFLMEKNSANTFAYFLENLKSNTSFNFRAAGFSSRTYEVEIKRIPKIISSSFELSYPSYLKRSPETFTRLSELSVPEGTKVKVILRVQDTDTLLYVIDNQEDKIIEVDENQVANYEFVLKESNQNLFVTSSNDYIIREDTLAYFFDVIKDQYPLIKVKEFRDSIFDSRRFYQGVLQDDYGFSRLEMHIQYTNEQGRDTIAHLPISINTHPASQEFFQYFDFGNLNSLKGTSLSYYFELWDNDAVKGYKSVKSKVFTQRILTDEEKLEQKDQRDQQIQLGVEQSAQQAQKLQNELKKLQDKIRGKKKLNWEDKKEMEDLLQQFEELQKKLQQQAKKNEENLMKSEDALKNMEEIRNKQEEIQKLMEEVLTPEMKEMMDEMRQMLEKENKPDKLQEKLEEMEFDAEFMQEQLERELELMKQLKFDQKLQESIDKLNELQKKQEELGKLNSLSTEQEKQMQDSLREEFNEFQKKLDEARKANSDLKNPNPMDNTAQEEQSIQESQGESSEQLSKGKNNAANKSQQKSAQQMKSLAEKLESMQEAMQSQSQGEDMENLKNILHNLVEVSFNQEQLMDKVKFTSNRDPKFPGFVEDQRRIVNDLTMIEDSLRKLALRNPSISPMVSRELKKIRIHSQKAFEDLKEMNTIGPTSANQKNKSSKSQQYIMTSVNNLALMLSEVLNQMQQQQMQSKEGKGACKKPKPGSGSSGSIKSMRQMQQALQKQMEKMKSEMDGQKKGGQQKKNGQGGQGGEKMSEEFAKLAAQQEALRKMLQEYREQMIKEGQMGQAKKLGEAAKKMEETETELVNKILSAESLMRQQDIITRLLESERAERERDQKEERESKEGKNEKKSNKKLILEYKNTYQKDLELLKTIPPGLKPFYKKLVDSYFNY